MFRDYLWFISKTRRESAKMCTKNNTVEMKKFFVFIFIATFCRCTCNHSAFSLVNHFQEKYFHSKMTETPLNFLPNIFCTLEVSNFANFRTYFLLLSAQKLTRKRQNNSSRFKFHFSQNENGKMWLNCDQLSCLHSSFSIHSHHFSDVDIIFPSHCCRCANCSWTSEAKRRKKKKIAQSSFFLLASKDASKWTEWTLV